ncbi:MAG: hypothetical protein IJD14_07285 [Christensenellaceae bacterium]|nr:hypothetical protein [Christensenellaceae bacterium]
MKKRFAINSACLFLALLVALAGVMLLHILLDKEEKNITLSKGTISVSDSLPVSFTEMERAKLSFNDVYRRAYAVNGNAEPENAPREGELSMLDATECAVREYCLLSKRGCVPEIDWSPFQIEYSEYDICRFTSMESVPGEIFGMWIIGFTSIKTDEHLMMWIDGKSGRIFSLEASLKDNNFRAPFEENTALDFAEYLDISNDSIDKIYDEDELYYYGTYSGEVSRICRADKIVFTTCMNYNKDRANISIHVYI